VSRTTGRGKRPPHTAERAPRKSDAPLPESPRAQDGIRSQLVTLAPRRLRTPLDPREGELAKPARRHDPVHEQRRDRRTELHARCWIIDPKGHHTVYIRLHDLSRGGLSVRAPLPFLAQHEVDLRLELPMGGLVHARGEVVWTHGDEWFDEDSIARPRLGARFLEILSGEHALHRLLGD
jgi:hypothetical protein